jgi:hypothetical protein
VQWRGFGCLQKFLVRLIVIARNLRIDVVDDVPEIIERL